VGVGEEGGFEEIEALPPQEQIINETRKREETRGNGKRLNLAGEFMR